MKSGRSRRADAVGPGRSAACWTSSRAVDFPIVRSIEGALATTLPTHAPEQSTDLKDVRDRHQGIDLLEPCRGRQDSTVQQRGVSKTVVIMELNSQHRAETRRRVGVPAWANGPARATTSAEFQESGSSIRTTTQTRGLVCGRDDRAAGRPPALGSGADRRGKFPRRRSKDVLLFIDNIFRFTQAGSEVSALLGRMPSAVGYQPTPQRMGQMQERSRPRRARLRPCRRSTCRPTTTRTRRPDNRASGRDDEPVAPFPSGIYPAVDPLASTSRILDPRILGDEHYNVAKQVKQTCSARDPRTSSRFWHPTSSRKTTSSPFRARANPAFCRSPSCRPAPPDSRATSRSRDHSRIQGIVEGQTRRHRRAGLLVGPIDEVVEKARQRRAKG